MEALIEAVLVEMQPILSPFQFKRLAEALRRPEGVREPVDNGDLLEPFLTAKEVEGCSPKTIAYYEATLQNMESWLSKPIAHVSSDDLRQYLSEMSLSAVFSKVTIDNIRRILSSFFSWLDEDYIVKSPVRKIKRVKTAVKAKETLSDEELEALRDSCDSKRDLAMVDLLASTGMRVGELIRLDIDDVDIQGRECVVTGKGNKQRPVYFDARTKLHLAAYLESRKDGNPALFVSLNGRTQRLSVCTVEKRIKALGERAQIGRVHPHKFLMHVGHARNRQRYAHRTGAKTAGSLQDRNHYALRYGEPKQCKGIS